MMREMADGYLPSIYYYLSVFNYFCLTGAQTFCSAVYRRTIEVRGHFKQ